ncbi:MerR family transcriptional regulator [Pullulanibacillus sp. KACC 23026]|uniref:MerR family transcriptional regulator n=1 Tax=Pullulanibacillus sp. KACC 23026 TaxID=3028315 RepID=UPI0023B0B9F7|nr:MerR family transcriptional regulator [Pullulanibacillus sp. KACC 23026]WEG11130.1 MerR family transcriptional regulator [Pullulanibacillus sp. KACC 23026]
MGEYTIGKLSERSGVSVKTIRFYSERGLLAPKRVATSGYRYYSDDDLMRLHQIVGLRWVGASLNQIQELLDGKLSLSDVLSASHAYVVSELDRLQRLESQIVEAENALSEGEEAVWTHLYHLQEMMMTTPEDRQEWLEQWWRNKLLDQSTDTKVEPFVEYAKKAESNVNLSTSAKLIRTFVWTGSRDGERFDPMSLPHSPREAGLTTDASWEEWKDRLQKASLALKKVSAFNPEDTAYQTALRNWVRCFGPLTPKLISSFHDELQSSLNMSDEVTSNGTIPKEILHLLDGLRFLTRMLTR